MQRRSDGSFLFAPKDLIAFLEGDFAAWCERNRVEQQAEQGSGRKNAASQREPDIPDEEMALAIRRGQEHEARYLSLLREREPGIVEIARGDTAHADTARAMQNGAPVIYQGELKAAPWMGIPDFLRRTNGTSTLGDFLYEPWDTKLAHSAKPYFLLQLSAYAEMLHAMLGARPGTFGFIYGTDAEEQFRTADFWHYYRRLKRSFEQFQLGWRADNQPDPALDRTHGRWSSIAEQQLRERDDLSLVAGMSRSQAIGLREAGISTVAQLAESTTLQVPRMSRDRLTSLRAQAAMQVATRQGTSIRWELRAADPERPRRGLALLPPPSPNDIFFDIEGFPYAPGGLEYLLGVVTVETGTPQFRDWWAHDAPQEQRAFEQFMDWAYARWQQDHSLHIYHYAAYERTAMQRLMGKYGTREHEVDELLRHDVLVDLYPIVLQGIVVGTPSYSLKDIEHLYMPPRTEGVTSASGSVVEYQKWLDETEPEHPSHSPILAGIRDYNKVDCESTVGLRDWLLERQRDAGAAYIEPGELGREEKATEPKAAQVLAEQLLQRADAPNLDAEKQRITRLLAWLLEFHRREDKPWWWRYFERMAASDEVLYDDFDCLAGLVRTSTASRRVKQSTAYEYRFDTDQETKLSVGDECAAAGTDDIKCKIESIDRDTGMIELKVGPKGSELPQRLSVIPASPVRNDVLKEAILRFVTAWIADNDCQPALADLLGRRPPRLTGSNATFRFDETGNAREQAVAAAKRLDRSVLCIQGPPGTGKTTTAAEIIIALIAGQRRVGIVANSHAVVLNLLTAVARRGDELGLRPKLVKIAGDSADKLVLSGRAKHIESKEAAAEIAAGPLVIGGTAWAFSRPEMAGTLDYLFIEEAGQFSLANTVAVGAAAANLILLGDQMQLEQPTQGSHPGESGLSALDYLLQDPARPSAAGHVSYPTVPPELGIFLGLSFRMQPALCQVVSEAYYEGRLKSAPDTVTNAITGALATSIGLEAGIRFIPTAHEGREQNSDEEVDRIEQLVRELLTCKASISGKRARSMTLDDILIVAPFNMQVRALKARLGAQARVGSVDKFQGQEAPVVIVSMCASTLDDAPRGPQFLLSPNRLNVALSRAQALAVVVGSPQLANVRVRSVEEMRLVSGWCRIEECTS